MTQHLKKIRQILVALILIAAVEGITSCDKYSYPLPAADPNQTWSLQTDIQPIFNTNCVSCHGGTRSPDLREGKSFEALTKGKYVNVPGETSRMYIRITTGDHVPRTTELQKQTILGWINQGALNN